MRPCRNPSRISIADDRPQRPCGRSVSSTLPQFWCNAASATQSPLWGMHAMDWNDIARRLEAAVLTAFDDLIALAPEPGFYALALVTEDGAMSVGLAANTEETVSIRLEAEHRESSGDPSEEEAWIRWGVGEWRHEGWRDDLFSDVNRLLCEAVLAPRSHASDSRLAGLVEAMTMALERLRQARGVLLADTILFVTLTDSDAAEAVEDASACRLNPPDLRDHFLARYA
ncbi:MAG: DUF4303 domain-containing protein [Oxalobacteraceae bacterium]|nr:MAG: DUF4303 domain-containing protein [Oxalobacteraceae bacterium]